MFLADAHSADPKELQVLDISLAMKLVVRPSSPDDPGHTEDSLQMTPSQCLRRAQQSGNESHVPVITSQSESRRTTLV